MDKLITRIKDVTLKPADTWPTIKSEEATVKNVIMQYLIFLAIVPGAAFFIRHLGERAWVALVGAVLYFVLCIAGIYLAAWLITLLSGQFGATASEIDSFKLVGYAMTPALLGTIFIILPFLYGLMFIIALYSLYLVWVGLPIMLTCPDDKRLPFSIVSMLVVYAVFVAAYFIPQVFVVVF